MTRLFRHPFAADLVALAYALVYFAWLAVRTPGTEQTLFIGEVSFYPLGLAVGWAYLNNARSLVPDRRTRVAWGILAAGAWSLWLIGNTWPRLVNFFGVGAYPAWVGYLEIAQHVLLIVAFFWFPNRRIIPRDRARFASDIALIVVVGLVLAFQYGTKVTERPSPASPAHIALAQVFFDWAVFVVGAVGVLQKRDAVTRTAMLLLLIANTLYLTANYLLSSMDVYHLGDAVDGIWFSAWVFRWTAARYAWHQYRRSTRVGQADEHDATDFRSNAFSYTLVSAAFILIISRVTAGDRRYLPLVVIASAVMSALLVLRQMAELRENRRLFESQLAQEARFRSLVQHASDVVLVLDAARCVTYVSPSVARVFGADAVPLGTALAALLPPDEAAALDPLFAHQTLTLPRLQTRMRTAAGDHRDIELVATDLRHDPAVAGVVLNCRDVTERNELERQLHHAQKLDAVGHLAGGLAHDFNNVLTAIRGYTELLREDLPPGAPARTDLGHIEQAVDRAAAVTKKLLAFSRKQAIQPAVVDLNTILVDLDPLLRQLVSDRIEVRTDLDPALWPLKVDPGQLEQVIINLATNARDAMPAGGLLQLTTANRVLTAPSPETGPLPPGAYVALVVADQGVGMAPDVRARIFEPFFSTKAKDRGMGLGLAMVHGIVTHAGGHITVESVEGRGTTFTLLLPRTLDTLRAAPATVPLPDHRPDARHILLVDDELGVRTVTRRMLERAGYRVLDAPDGLAALDLVTAGTPFDLLVTDMVMPGLDGRGLIARVRALRPGLPIVCITGFAGDARTVGDLAPHVAAVVTKPFASDVLLRAVAAALRVS